MTPDGKSFLYLRRDETREEQPPEYSYCLVDPQGESPRSVFTTAVGSEEILCMVINPSCISADGRSLLAVQSRDNRGIDGKQPADIHLVPVVAPLDGKGEPVRLECERGSVTGVGFAGNDPLYLDAALPGGKPGYLLKRVSGGQTKTIHQDPLVHAVVLNVSPSGRYAAFFVAKGDALTRGQAKLRVIDLQSGQAFTSPEFHAEAVVFDGPPLLYWDAAETGLYAHVSNTRHGRLPFQLTHWSFTTERGRLMTDKKNLALLSVLNDDWLVCWSHGAEQGGLLRANTGELWPLSGKILVLGGRGRHVVITNPEQEGVYTAEIPLPGPMRRTSTSVAPQP